MKDFALYQPTSLDQALSVLAKDRHGKTMPLAGGQDLVPEMKEHLAEPDSIVDLKRIDELGKLALDRDGRLTIGATVTLETLAEDENVRARWPALAEAASLVGSPQIRSVATVGGNLNQRPRCWYYRNEQTKCLKKGGNECFAYEGVNRYNAILGGGPSYIVHPSDLAPALVCLDAEVVLRKAGGAERRVPLAEFYTLPSESEVTRETVLAPDEILTRVEVPAGPANARSTYVKFRERGSYDWALSAVALRLVLDGGTIQSASVVLGGVAPVPWRSPEAEQALAGSKAEMKSFRAAAEAALTHAEPLAHNGYKVPLTKGLIVKALDKLVRS